MAGARTDSCLGEWLHSGTFAGPKRDPIDWGAPIGAPGLAGS